MTAVQPDSATNKQISLAPFGDFTEFGVSEADLLEALQAYDSAAIKSAYGYGPCLALWSIAPVALRYGVRMSWPRQQAWTWSPRRRTTVHEK